MGWLSDWDDLIHGTAVFGAAVPFCLAWLLAAWAWIRSWTALAAAMAVPLLWWFGWPSLPPRTSEDAVPFGLALGGAMVGLESWRAVGGWRRVGIGIALWTGLAWVLYPAWLAADGGWIRRATIALAIGASIAAWAALLEWRAAAPGQTRRFLTVPVAALIPPTLALSVLLQFGGSTRFAQSAGAMASALTAICIVTAWRGVATGMAELTSLWAMLFGWLLWLGWLYSEIHLGAALTLLAAWPAAALGSLLRPGVDPRRVPWPELAAAGLVSAWVAWMAWSKFRGASDTMGY
jgi:hypothetical protein